jgi:hypothetical protein
MKLETDCVGLAMRGMLGWPEPYMYSVYLVISLPKAPYIHRIHMVLANLNGMCIRSYTAKPSSYPWLPHLRTLLFTLHTFSTPLTTSPVSALPFEPSIVVDEERMDCQTRRWLSEHRCFDKSTDAELALSATSFTVFWTILCFLTVIHAEA